MEELKIEIPDYNVLLQLEPEELGNKILFILKSRQTNSRETLFAPANSLHELIENRSGAPYAPQVAKAEISLAIREAFAWLETQGFLIVADGGNDTYRVLSRRARNLQRPQDLADYSLASILPKELLHPSIADQIWTSFIRRDYDVAVFTAMKSVEVAVRTAGGYADTDIGVNLMRKAFHTTQGPLADLARPEAERQALLELFTGAIGSYKNPQSHRHVSLSHAGEAAEIILLANHLLRIVDSRRQARATP